jgi:hypothetical protein
MPCGSAEVVIVSVGRLIVSVRTGDVLAALF